MIIPDGYGHVVAGLSFGGKSEGMAITFGIDTPAGVAFSVVADDVSDVVGDFIKSTVSEVVTYDGLDLVVPDGLGGTLHFLSTNNNGPGIGAADCFPPNTAYLFQKRTLFGGRANRGRFYVPGVNETAVTNTGALDPATIAALQSVATAFLTALDSDANAPMVILHSGAAAPTPVSSLLIDNTVATQRRRLR